MGEDERGAGDATDFAGAGGDVLQGAPAAGEQGEPAFPEATQGTEQGVDDPSWPPARTSWTDISPGCDALA